MELAGTKKRFQTFMEEFAGRRVATRDGAIYLVTLAGLIRVDEEGLRKRAERASGLSGRQRRIRRKARRR